MWRWLVIGWMACAPAVLAAQPLRSPWSDAAARSAAARPAAACPVPPVLPASLDAADFYSDSSHSIIDPARQAAYQAAVRPLHTATLALERLADAGQGVCAMQWLQAFAAAGALTGRMSANQADYTRGWLLGAWAVAALKAAPGAGGVPGPVADWLIVLAQDVRRYFDARPGTSTDSRNNHRYWAGFAVAAAGIAADRRDLFDWGIASARIGLHQVDAEGALPLEMARKSRALHYHLFAAAPLVLTAELAAANGIDLYAEPDAAGQPGALRHLVARALSGLSDPSWFADRAGAPQVPADGDKSSEVGWSAPVLRRFPDLAPRPAAAGGADLYGGGRPPGS